MSGRESGRLLARRSFFSKLGIGLTAGGAAGLAASPAQAQSAEGGRWQPVRHAQDDWLDPGHREPSPLITARTVRSRILTSSHSDQLVTYSTSSSTRRA